MRYLIFFTLLATIAGAVLPIQAGLNTRMSKAIGDPVFAALISFVVGSIALFLYAVITHVDLSRIGDVRHVNITVWAAGILGAFYVAAVIILLPKIGAALTFSLVVAGQLSMSLIVDHYGLFGVQSHPFNLARFSGIILVVLGVILIRKF